MPLAELAERLSISTAEVEGIERRGVPDTDGNLGLFRVGKVLEAVKHPNADRLQLCRVDIGEGEPRQIVCGAWNFGAGATVAVALPGAVLPGGLELEQRKVRGELSDGMILAEDEVELGTDHSGIMVLPETEPGTPLVDVLPLVEEVLLVESTGNRPDLLSIYGLAREVAALYDLELGHARGQTPSRSRTSRWTWPSRTSRAARATSAGSSATSTIGPSPIWLKTRLLNAGMRPICNVVDVTNYVMLALGNPLHAFDLTTLRGGKIIVRRASPGETIRTLDGVDRRLEPDDLMIADAERSRRARRDHGRRGDRDRRVDDGGAARGGQLRADGDLPHLRAPAAAHRGLEPLGEGRRPVPGRARREARHPADRRDRRRALGRPTPTSTTGSRSGRRSATGPSGPTS